MKIQKVTDPAFRKYGQVLEGYDFTSLIKEMKHTPVPEDVIYVPSVEELEALDVMKKLQKHSCISCIFWTALAPILLKPSAYKEEINHNVRTEKQKSL